MPIHDWTRVRANRFHDFHQGWTVGISSALNAVRLPRGYFAMIERKLRRYELGGPPDPVPDIVAGSPVRPGHRFVVNNEAASYARKANRITIRHPDGQIVAVVEIVSPGNKNSRHGVVAFARKAVEFLLAGVHLLIVDLFPPGRRDPLGIHKVIWDRLCDEPYAFSPAKPLTIASYAAGAETVAYVESIAVGDPLPEMPVFLTPDRYVPCPLEETYQTAWGQFPAPLKGPLEAPLPP